MTHLRELTGGIVKAHGMGQWLKGTFRVSTPKFGAMIPTFGSS